VSVSLNVVQVPLMAWRRDGQAEDRWGAITVPLVGPTLRWPTTIRRAAVTRSPCRRTGGPSPGDGSGG